MKRREPDRGLRTVNKKMAAKGRLIPMFLRHISDETIGKSVVAYGELDQRGNLMGYAASAHFVAFHATGKIVKVRLTVV